MMPTTITAYDGANSIGGNKILLESRDTSVFFDFGLNFPKYGMYYEEFVKPRSVRGVYDPIIMGIVPQLKGIYRNDLFPTPDLCERMLPEGSKKVDLNAVFLSHAHADHIGCLTYIDLDIPIISSPMTAVMMKALQDSGKGGIEAEYVYINPRVLKPDGIISSDRNLVALQRRFLFAEDFSSFAANANDFWNTVPASSRILNPAFPEACDKLNGLAVKAFPLDHSIPGAAAFAIETDDGWIVYTGDLRTHGAKGFMTAKFAEEAAKLSPVALIIEGTHVQKEVQVLEATVRDHCLKAVEGAEDKLVIADFGPRHIERLQSFYDIAQATNRSLVITSKDAYLLSAMNLLDCNIPNPVSDTAILLYDEPSGLKYGWQKDIIYKMSHRLIPPSEIRGDPGQYILCFSLFDLNDLAELAPDSGGVYIYSNSELYGEEQKIDFERIRNWLKRFDFQLIGDPEAHDIDEVYHATGHITGPELEKVVRTIRPKKIMPVHTVPEKSRDWFVNKFGGDFDVVFLEPGIPYSI